ncbi:hypothetical protein [Mucilaginibacter sp.]|uniref:hypothetical protein n=1 Tax=Mucilaginibacter sp. TaxID=1882438 RepID=UPI003D0EBA8E
MGKIYSKYLPLFFCGLSLIISVSSCKKDKKSTPTPTPPTSLATLGLFELIIDSSRVTYIPITKVGTQTVNYDGVFDTGSTGMTIDANGIIPASMITSSGIQFTGDSVVVNGITITNKKSTMSYGNAQGQVDEYGNLAYTTVTIGEPGNDITTTRIPIFLYYQVKNITTGQIYGPHQNDVFGVGPGVSYTNSAIGSPLSYFKLSNGQTSGFKLSMLNSSMFSRQGTFVPGLLTIGLVPDDLSSSSGFVMHPLTYYSVGGYSSEIKATINYNGSDINAIIVFDTGNPTYYIIADGNAVKADTILPPNTTVKVTTSGGFSYSYTTTGAYNLTQVVQPSFTNDPRTIFSIDFFISNEFLLDYTNHRIGLKNN